MEAGYGAEEQATRRARKVRQLQREQAAHEATRDSVAAALAQAQRQQRAWSAGAEGERMVAETLDPLSHYGWTCLHDVHWPGRPIANIDHIAIGPGGVVIIDAKNWTGHVVMHDGVLTQNGYRRDREVEGVAGAAAAVAAMFRPQHHSKVWGVICLAGQDQPPVSSVPGVTVVGRLQLASYLVGLPTVFSPYDVADTGRHLASALEGPIGHPLASSSVQAAPARAPRRAPRQAPRAARGQGQAAFRSSGTPRSGGRRRRRGPALSGLLWRLGLVAVLYLFVLAYLQSLGGA